MKTDERLAKGGEIVRQLRLRRGWSQERLAQELGWDKSRVSKVENGKLELTLAAIEKLGPALGQHPALIVLACLDKEYPDLFETEQGKAVQGILRELRKRTIEK